MSDSENKRIRFDRSLRAGLLALQALLVMFGSAVWLAFEFGIILPWSPDGVPSAAWRWALPPWDHYMAAGLVATGVSAGLLLLGVQMLLGEWLRRRGVAVVDPGVEAGIHDSLRTRRFGMARAPQSGVRSSCAWPLGVTPLGVAAWWALPAGFALALSGVGDSLWAVAGAQIVIAGGRAVAIGLLVALFVSIHVPRWAAPLLSSRTFFFITATLLLMPSFVTMLRLPLSGDESSLSLSAVGLLREGTLMPSESVRVETFQRIGTNASHVDVIDPDGPAGPAAAVPLHGPGVSVLIAPVAWLSYATGAGSWPLRVVCFGITLLVLGGMRSFARVLGAPRWAAGSIVLLVGTTSVMPMNLLSLYPEPFAAAGTIWALWALGPLLMARHHDKPEGVALSRSRLALLLIVIVILPWLHLKFVALSVLLAACMIWATLGHRVPRGWWWSGGAVASVVLWFALHQWLFGGQIFTWAWTWNLDYLASAISNSEGGLLPFFPWVLLAIPAVGAVPRMARWRVAITVGAVAITYALAATQSLNWFEGGGPPVRFLLPLTVLAGALLPVLVSRMPATWLVVAPAVLLAGLVTVRVIIDPLEAMTVALQTTRTVHDLAVDAVSWREMWPSVALLGRSQPTSTEPLGVLAAALSAVILGATLCLRRPWWTAGAAALLVCVAPAAARIGQSSEWGRSALALMSRTTREPAWSCFPPDSRVEARDQWLGEVEYFRLVRLQATQRPVSTTFPRSVVRTHSIFFGFRRAKDELLSIGPMHLHAGRYLFTVRGIADTERARAAKRDVAAAGLELAWQPGTVAAGGAVFAPQLALAPVSARPANAPDDPEVLITLPITITSPSEWGTISLRRRGGVDARVDDMTLVHTDSAFTVYEETEAE